MGSRMSLHCRENPGREQAARGAYIELKGMEGFTGMYVGEIPSGDALIPENHLYEELIYILQGFGATEIWSAGDEKRKMHFEWHQGSLFAIPLNTRHRMINGSNEPADLSGGYQRAVNDRLAAQHSVCHGVRLQVRRPFRWPGGLLYSDIGSERGRRFHQLGVQLSSPTPAAPWWILPRPKDMACASPPSTWAAAHWSAISPSGRWDVITRRIFIKAGRFC